MVDSKAGQQSVVPSMTAALFAIDAAAHLF
jgi:hypothetical protein